MKLNLIQYLLFALFINYKMLFSLFVISETPFFCHSRSRRLSGIQELATQSLFTAYQETNLAKKVYKHNKYYADSFFLFFNIPTAYSWIPPESIRDGNDKEEMREWQSGSGLRVKSAMTGFAIMRNDPLIIFIIVIASP